MTAERWGKARSFHHSLFPAERIAAERQQSVSVCLPARECADTVCFLDGGVILEEGPPGQIFTSPREPRTREFLARVLEAEKLA